MLLPTQRVIGQAANDILRSMLDSIETQRKEREQEKPGAVKPDPIVEARISLGEKAKRAEARIAEALFNKSAVNLNEMKVALMDKIGEELGLERGEGVSGYGYGRMIEEVLKNSGAGELIELSKTLGLDELGITLNEFIAAIKNPYGDEDDKLDRALTKEATGGTLTNVELSKVMQRLDHAADRRTLEETKLEPQMWDPTRVDDAEMRAEREKDIQALEVSEKLEDVEDMAKALEERNEKIAGASNDDAGAAASADADMLAILAATVEAVRTDADAPATDESADGTDNADAAAETKPTEAGSDPDAIEAAQTEARIMAETEEEPSGILPVSSDEIGIYALIKKMMAEEKLAA